MHIFLCIQHEMYGMGLGYAPNDIQLVKTSQPVETGDHVQPARIAYHDSVEGQVADIAGWSRQGYGGTFTNAVVNTFFLINAQVR